MFDLESVRYLLIPDGENLLREAERLEGSFLQRVTTLRKSYPPDLSNTALELLDLRKRASKKFSRAGEMFFTREALEQSSGEKISAYRAKRFAPDSQVLDLACGIGGDAIGLAARCLITAIDIDPVRIAMAERNLAVYGLADRVRFLCADVTEIPLDADAAFIDPSRRREGKRTVSLHEMSPSLDFILHLRKQIPNCAVKLSPASDDEELESLGAEIEFISESGECKEAVAWFGEFKTCEKRATVLPEEISLTGGGEKVRVVPPAGYLYEPDPCVIRAHMVDLVADRIGAGRLDERIAYLTGNDFVETPLADGYEILDSLPFNIKSVKARLRDLGAGKVIVKKRGVPFDPIEVAHSLKLGGKREFVLVLTRIGGKVWALICTPCRKIGDSSRI
jgi:hypothetical protein